MLSRTSLASLFISCEHLLICKVSGTAASPKRHHIHRAFPSSAHTYIDCWIVKERSHRAPTFVATCTACTETPPSSITQLLYRPHQPFQASEQSVLFVRSREMRLCRPSPSPSTTFAQFNPDRYRSTTLDLRPNDTTIATQPSQRSTTPLAKIQSQPCTTTTTSSTTKLPASTRLSTGAELYQTPRKFGKRFSINAAMPSF